MAVASGMPPMLRLRRSTQSGTYGMAAAAAWVTLYTESSSVPYLFCGSIIDLSAMQAADTINIRVRKQLVPGGGWVNHGLTAYVGAPPVGHPAIYITPLPDVYGIEIAAQQTAGVLRTLVIDAYDAKRIGLT